MVVVPKWFNVFSPSCQQHGHQPWRLRSLTLIRVESYIYRVSGEQVVSNGIFHENLAQIVQNYVEAFTKCAYLFKDSYQSS
jgi:hypothetical protein